MAEFNDRYSFQAWLKGKPRDWALVLAARSALRALPTLVAVRKADDFDSVIVLPAVRAMALAWTAATYPVRARELAVAAASYAAADSAASSSSSSSYAAASAASAAAADSAAAASAYAASAASYASASRAAAAAGVWRAVSADATRLEHSGTAVVRLTDNLWPLEQPKWAISQFNELSALLVRSDRTWQVWIDWYQSRLTGGPSFGLPTAAAEEIDLRIGQQDDDWWQRGPKAVNTEIAAWVRYAASSIAVDEAIRASGWELSGKSETSEDSRPTVKEFIANYLKKIGIPATNKEILAAFGDVDYTVKRKTVEWALVQLNNASIIFRLRRGVYVHSSIASWSDLFSEPAVTAPAEHIRPKPVEGIASPFDFEISASKRIALAADALGQIRVPDHRSQNDAALRTRAASQLCSDLIADIGENCFQIRSSYRTHLERYRNRLPFAGGGNIYEADAEMRLLRDQLVADLKYGTDEFFARRLARLLEQHAGLRVYFPDLLSFYDDVREGLASEPPPLEALGQLGKIVADFTPDVFEQNVGESLGEIEVHKPIAISSGVQTSDDSNDAPIVLPPDPIADIDPVRAAQHAKAGAFNRLWSAMLKLEKVSRGIERTEKAVSVYQRYIAPVLDWLSHLPPPPSG